jgi:hypothetical protein
MASNYVFDRLDTALYLSGSRARDYLPKHGMMILEYTDIDLILRLIIYTEDKTRENSKFAWALYKWNEYTKLHDLDSVELAIFDGSKKEQVLPPKNKIGMIIYHKLTGI